MKVRIPVVELTNVPPTMVDAPVTAIVLVAALNAPPEVLRSSVPPTVEFPTMVAT